jgi:hypothetical protein
MIGFIGNFLQLQPIITAQSQWIYWHFFTITVKDHKAIKDRNDKLVTELLEKAWKTIGGRPETSLGRIITGKLGVGKKN